MNDAPERTLSERVWDAFYDIYEVHHPDGAGPEMKALCNEVAALEQERPYSQVVQETMRENDRLREAIVEHVNADGVAEAKRTYAKLRRIARLTEGENDAE